MDILSVVHLFLHVVSFIGAWLIATTQMQMIDSENPPVRVDTKSRTRHRTRTKPHHHRRPRGTKERPIELSANPHRSPIKGGHEGHHRGRRRVSPIHRTGSDKSGACPLRDKFCTMDRINTPSSLREVSFRSAGVFTITRSHPRDRVRPTASLYRKVVGGLATLRSGLCRVGAFIKNGLPPVRLRQSAHVRGKNVTQLLFVDLVVWAIVLTRSVDFAAFVCSLCTGGAVSVACSWWGVAWVNCYLCNVLCDANQDKPRKLQVYSPMYLTRVVYGCTLMGAVSHAFVSALPSIAFLPLTDRVTSIMRFSLMAVLAVPVVCCGTVMPVHSTLLLWNAGRLERSLLGTIIRIPPPTKALQSRTCGILPAESARSASISDPVVCIKFPHSQRPPVLRDLAISITPLASGTSETPIIRRWSVWLGLPKKLCRWVCGWRHIFNSKLVCTCVVMWGASLIALLMAGMVVVYLCYYWRDVPGSSHTMLYDNISQITANVTCIFFYRLFRIR
jgi:hypothetical protein